MLQDPVFIYTHQRNLPFHSASTLPAPQPQRLGARLGGGRLQVRVHRLEAVVHVGRFVGPRLHLKPPAPLGRAVLCLPQMAVSKVIRCT